MKHKESTTPMLNPDQGQYLQRIRDVFKLNHRISKVNSIYLTTTHVVALLSFVAFVYAPDGFLATMLIYLCSHIFLAVISTTGYAHRMISHRATKSISTPVHILFGYLGQTLAVQGSVGEWAADIEFTTPSTVTEGMEMTPTPPSGSRQLGKTSYGPMCSAISSRILNGIKCTKPALKRCSSNTESSNYSTDGISSSSSS